MIVTGGAGFIGSHMAAALVRKGYDTHVVDNLATGRRNRVPKGATFHKVDIRSGKKLAQIFKGADAVFHFAALPRVQYSIDHPEETNDVNVIGTHAVFLAAKDANVRRVVYSASSSAYGDQAMLPYKETMPTNPLSPYAAHKYIGEVYARYFHNVFGLETVSLRYFNVYGPGQNPGDSYPLVTIRFISQRKEGKPMTITGDGKQTRDFTHVNDVVRANLLAAFGKKVGKGEVINIGSGKSYSVNHIAKLIGGPTLTIPARLEPRNTLADNRLAKKLLGWKPLVTLEEGIAELKKEAGLL